jgi:dTDP-4-amino-4,6-dideoxygalactose transaminase
MSEKRQIGFGDWVAPKKLKTYVNDVIKSRRLTYGKYCQALEKKWGEMNGTKYNMFCSSGTGALFTAIATLANANPENARKRKYIIIPATDFISGFNAILYNNFQPLFCDVDNSYNLDLKQLEYLLSGYGREIFAVMPVSLMGVPVDGAAIRELTDKYTKGAFIVLDSCENICSKFDGKYPEEFAHFTCWSGYISHLWTVGAAGGMLGTNDEKLAVRARSVINHGRMPEYMSIDDDNNVEQATLKDIAAKRFKFYQTGFNFRLGEIEAAFGLSMLEDNFQEGLEKRVWNGTYLYENLKKFPLRMRYNDPRAEIKWMMFPIEVKGGDKWDLIHFLEARGIETREILPMYQKITEPYLGNPVRFQSNYPVSHRVYQNGFYIGCHQLLTKDDLDYIINAFEEYFKK